MKRLRVYLSSTFEDLMGYREAVFAALEKAGLDVARMEAYTAADERPVDKCLCDVGQSDLYVGIFGWRYGYEPPAHHGNPHGKSVTELEYREAQRLNLHKLVFLADEATKPQWPAHFRDEITGASERGEKLRTLREELKTEKSVGFFQTPDELAKEVLAAIMYSELGRRPYNVPLRPPGFVPRPALTTQILDSLVGAGCVPGTNALLVGAGGFGKSALAIDACQLPEIVSAFPDGILWAALGEKPDLAMKLRDLYVTAAGDAPDVVSADALGEALASALKNRRCLVVIDDAWRVEDLKPFVQFEAPRLLVTTRIRNLLEQAGQGVWREVQVDEMNVDEAADLLGRFLPIDDRVRETLRQLADRLGCWPLLLELANARLREEHKTRENLVESIDRVTKLLEQRGVLGFDRRDSNERNAAVARSVDVSLEFAEEMFSGLAQRAADMSVFPEDVPIPMRALADLWAMGELDVEEEVARPLHNLSLLHWDRDTAQIQLHDMIRRVLEARLADAAAVHRRLVDAWSDPYHLPHDYAWRWYGWHCVHAQEQCRLHRLLLDCDWIRAKLNASATIRDGRPRIDVNSLLSDYDYLVDVAEVSLVQRALRMSSHVLGKYPEQVGFQLFGRLGTSDRPALQRLCGEAIEHAERTALIPARPALSPPSALLLTLAGHEYEVYGATVLADGRRVLSWSQDGTLRVWDLARGDALRTLEGHKDAVYGAALLADGRRALSWSADGTLKVWDLERGEALHTLAGHTHSVDGATLFGDGARALSWSRLNDDTLKVWDVEQGELVHTLAGHEAPVDGATPLGDGHRALSWSVDGTLKVWDLERGEVLHTLVGHKGPVTAATLLADGRALSWSVDGTLKVWDLERGEVLHTLLGHKGPVTAATLLADGRALSWSVDGTLKVWELERSEALRTLEGHDGSVTGAKLLADGQRVLSWSADRTLKVWNLERKEPLYTLARHAGWIFGAAVFPDGQRALSWSEDGTLKLWDLERGKALGSFVGHERSVVGAALLADGRQALSWSHDRTLKVWDLEQGELPDVFADHAGSVSGTIFLADGQRGLSWSADGTLKVWDLERGKTVHTLAGHEGSVTGATVLAEDQQALSWSQDRTLKLWNLARGAVVQTFVGHAGPVTGATLLADRWRALSWSADGTLKVWNLERGEVVHTLAGHTGPIDGATLLADGRRALSWSADMTLMVWDLNQGEALLTLAGHTSSVTGAALLANRRALSWSVFGTLQVWDLDQGEPLRTLAVQHMVTDAKLLADGRRALSSSYGGALTVWDLDQDDELRTLVGHDGWVYGVMLLADGRRILSWSADRTLRLMDLENGTLISTYFADAALCKPAVDEARGRIFVGDKLGRIHIIRLGVEGNR